MYMHIMYKYGLHTSAFILCELFNVPDCCYHVCSRDYVLSFGTSLAKFGRDGCKVFYV